MLIEDNVVFTMRYSSLCSIIYLFMSQEDIIILSMHIFDNWVSKCMLKTKHKAKHLKSIKGKNITFRGEDIYTDS